jgi:amidophosphoribosyltransferase
MCSLSAVYYDKNAVKRLLYLSNAGMNRGNQSAGFSVHTGDGYVVTKAMKKDGGISLAYKELTELVGGRDITFGIAQTRYSTKGKTDKKHAQPFRVNINHEIIAGHNGNIANSREFAELYNLDGITETESDTEVLALHLSESDSVEAGIKDIVKDAIGSYNLTVLDENKTLTVLRDPMGFHPLWEGRGKNGEVYFASEDSALYSIGCFKTRELEPGEMMQVSEDGIKNRRFKSSRIAQCSFEPFYFMKPGSRHKINRKHKPVQEIRYELGSVLGKKENMVSENGIVVPVLDSGGFFAEGFADETKMLYREAITKNTGDRIYMDPDKRDPFKLDLSRKEKAMLKHITLPYYVDGMDVFLLEDSIVRGDTSSAITGTLRDAGAKSVHWRSAFLKIPWGCIYGLDHSTKKELIAAHDETEEEIANKIGADSVRYLTIGDMLQVFGNIDNYCFACATGKYPTPVPKECISAIEL